VTTRRDFLKTGSFAALAASLPLSRAWGAQPLLQTPIDTAPRVGDPMLRELAMRALDSARAAGATYADVRLTLTRVQRFFSGNPLVDEETIGVGVRALVGGFWGFVASPVWSLDEMARLGRAAAEQARTNDWGSTQRIELGDPPPAIEGSWATPIKRDPFTVPVEEKMDFINAAQAYVGTFRGASAGSLVGFRREERTFASTEGSFFSQTIHTALGEGSYFSVSANDSVDRLYGGRRVEWFSAQAGGYEVLGESTLLDDIPRLYEEARRLMRKDPVTVGRYDVVFDATAMAAILSRSLGSATEIDRIRGFEANAGGTSYLSPTSEVMGTEVGAKLLNVMADRTHPRGAATVKLDDDGVAPDEFPIVKDGVLMDLATSREHVPELAKWYQSRGMPARSHGCAGSETAMDVPVVQMPNLRLLPGQREASFEDLVSGVKRGMAIIGGDCYMDFRRLTGQGHGEAVYEIRNGKLGKPISGAAYLFRSPELWKDIVALGGPKSVMWRGFDTRKGQPSQLMRHSVAAVPALVKNIVAIDISKKI
jgi:TldD protein